MGRRAAPREQEKDVMDRIRVAAVNWTGLDDDNVEEGEGVAALQKQVTVDLAPAWGVDAELFSVKKGTIAQYPGAWGLILIDRTVAVRAGDPSPAGAYGNATFFSRLPLTKVFIDQASPDQDWTFYASHSLLEMLVNPVMHGLPSHR
jgi:hypothetical protein